ncbi:MAG: hypothetical protein ACUZ8N_10335 [Candidatus Scalindua sp.]
MAVNGLMQPSFTTSYAAIFTQPGRARTKQEINKLQIPNKFQITMPACRRGREFVIWCLPARKTMSGWSDIMQNSTNKYFTKNGQNILTKSLNSFYQFSSFVSSTIFYNHLMVTDNSKITCAAKAYMIGFSRTSETIPEANFTT